MATKNRGLGRGLSALMADIQEPEQQTDTPDAPRRSDLTVPIERVEPNAEQPRRAFTEEALAELSSSIREKGIIQPLIVRPNPSGEGYQIVAGERRWRAAQMAQLHEVPVIVREFDDTEVLEVAIIENIQRADLNPIEEATGYRQLMDRFGHTQDKLAEAMGKSRPHIANLMRLLSLPDDVQDMLRDGSLTAGHARALIGNDRASELAQDIVKRGLSVRDVERLVKAQNNPAPRQTPVVAQKDADTKALEGDLSAAIGMNVGITHDADKGKGVLTIKYKDLEQLDDLIRILNAGR